MKLTNVLLVAGLTLAIGVSANAQGKGLGIVGSPHDFQAAPWNPRAGEACRVCHVPHDHDRASKYGTVGLLWNHKLSSASYTMYTSPSLNGAQDSQPTGVSKMCLGCHDGTVALDETDKGGGTNTFIQDTTPGFRVLGGIFWTGTNGDLRSTHPLSITYDNVADPKLRDPATTAMGASGFIKDVLEGGKVQCSSCHDVHDQPGESVPGTHLLRVKNNDSAAPSALCLVCHIK